jgi:hypothetical protein
MTEKLKHRDVCAFLGLVSGNPSVRIQATYCARAQGKDCTLCPAAATPVIKHTKMVSSDTSFLLNFSLPLSLLLPFLFVFLIYLVSSRLYISN